ncbi:MAG: hypothetical protein KDA80_22880 [Planctomycetaceae bacterium]|nr:hypothetical protein [Planctomycetaceae bacterium]
MATLSTAEARDEVNKMDDLRSPLTNPRFQDRTECHITFLILFSILLVLRAPSPSFAEDRVTYVPEGASSAVTVLGNVDDYTGRRLTLRTKSGAVRFLPAESVQSIETIYDPLHLKGIEQFQSGDHKAAIESFRQAIPREPRDWVERELYSWILKCALREQDLTGAIEAFLRIVKNDPETRHWGLAPLIWVPQSVSEGLREAARPWLVSPHAPERLLGASLLLLEPVYGEPAERELDRLSRDTNIFITTYAKAQLWRLKLGARDVNDIVLANWKSQIDRMPRGLRGGPQYLLSRGFELNGDIRRAVAESLWIPFVYVENERVAARALSDSADLLRRSGMELESKRLFQELQLRYPWSSEARSTRGQLEGQ